MAGLGSRGAEWRSLGALRIALTSGGLNECEEAGLDRLREVVPSRGNLG
jgi:hypothetical protein